MSAGYMRQCAGKKRFELKDDALDARGALAASLGMAKDKFHAYRCVQCLGWHVGGAGRITITRSRRPGKRPNRRMRGRM